MRTRHTQTQTQVLRHARRGLQCHEPCGCHEREPVRSLASRSALPIAAAIVSFGSRPVERFISFLNRPGERDVIDA